MYKVLIVDDEPSILTLLQYNLEKEGYSVTTAEDGKVAWDLIQGQAFDIILLDIMLPKMDGIEVCRRSRQANITTPIIMLTAKDNEYDKVISLELGADDYITKPFSPRELIARMRAIMRRLKTEAEHEDPKEELIKSDELEINTSRYEVYLRGKLINLTPKEFELLVYLARRPGRIISRELLLSAVWDYDYAGETRLVDIHISHLREKLEEDSRNPKYIKTQRGFGYKFQG